MLKNEDILEEFKKSITATTKSISKNKKVEINFTKEISSIDGNIINLTEPLETYYKYKKKLTHGEAISIGMIIASTISYFLKLLDWIN